MAKDSLCEKIEMIKKGEHPGFVHEFESSYLVVGDHQFYDGYCLLITKTCVRELHELDRDEYNNVCDELYLASVAINKAFKPWKLNHMCLGNQDPHIHWHILPRYESDKYHKTIPLSDLTKGEISLEDYKTTPEQAKIVVEKIRKYLN